MKRKILILSLPLLLLGAAGTAYLLQDTKATTQPIAGQCCSGTTELATCTGSKSCTACKNCKYCKHCSKNGGSCGVCR